MNERLLTEEEIIEVWDTVDFERHMNNGHADDYNKSDHEKVSEYDRAILKIQDAETLKAVGKWLDKTTRVFGTDIINDNAFEKAIEALKRGEFSR